jgi:hypothetical protein
VGLYVVSLPDFSLFFFLDEKEPKSQGWTRFWLKMISVSLKCAKLAALRQCAFFNASLHSFF